MEKTFSILLLLMSMTMFSQMTSFTVTNSSQGYVHLTTGEVTVWTDNFDAYTPTENLHAQTNWGQEVDAIDINDSGGDNVINPNSTIADDPVAAYFTPAGIMGDQSVSFDLETVTNWNRIGVAVRMSGGSGTYYAWYGNGVGGGNTSELVRWNAGSLTVLATGDAWVSGTNYRLDIVGYELQCYVDDGLDTSVSGDGKYDDTASGSKIDTGYGGVAGIGNDTNCDGDNFRVEEL